MHFEKKTRPQNQQPQALIQSRKDLALQNYEAVRVTVQAMRKRGTPTSEITVQTVAKESGVSVATIYRREDLFVLIRKVNPDLQRRQSEQVYRNDLVGLQAELAEVQKDKDYYKKEAELAKIGSRGLKQEITQLRKKNLDLQREITTMKQQMATCTCDREALRLSLDKKEPLSSL